MKIVLYFSAAFGLFWLIHGVLSHREPTRSSVQHSDVKEDKEKLSFESAGAHDKVLIKSESPLRGRKIHQTAWSKEEGDGEKDQVTKLSGNKKIAGAESTWSLEKILKYLTSLVYTMDETEQPTHIWITSEDVEDKSQSKPNEKIEQKSTEINDESTDEISKNIQNNGRREYSSTYKNSYLKDYYENFYGAEKSDQNYESNEVDGNSFEYENFDEEDDDDRQINYKVVTKKYRNVKSNHLFQDEEYGSDSISMKSDASSSSQENEIIDSGDCFEDTDKNLKQNSQEIKNTEENINRSKQETDLKKRYEGIKNKLRNRTKKDGLPGKGNKIVVLNGTKVTEQNDKSKKIEGLLKTTSIPKQKSKVEFLDTDNKVNEETKKKISINNHQKAQGDSYVVEDTVQTKSNYEDTKNDSISQTTKNEFTDSVTKLSVLNNSNDTEENLTSSVMQSKAINKQQENNTSLTETMQTVYRNDDNLKNEVMYTEKVQNEETLVTTSSINNVANLNLDETTVTTFGSNTDPMTEVIRQENMQTITNEEVQNDETLFTTSSINTTKLNLSENKVTTLEVNPETSTDVTQQENIQTINNEETINKPVEILTIQTNNAELNNREHKALDVENETSEFKITETQLEGNQNEFLQNQARQISIAENNQQNNEYLNKKIYMVNETLLASKDDNGFEYLLGGNEFVPSNTFNEEIYKDFNNNNIVFNKSESENKSLLLKESIMTELQNLQQVDQEQQESFDTILEFMYKHSKNPLILSLKENSNSTY